MQNTIKANIKFADTIALIFSHISHFEMIVIQLDVL